MPIPILITTIMTMVVKRYGEGGHKGEEKKEDDKDNNNNDVVPRPHYNIIFSPRRTSASYSMDTIKVTSSCGVSLLEKVPIPYVLN